MQIQDEKAQIRKQIRILKSEFPDCQKIEQSDSIFEQLEQLEIFRSAKIIMTYWAMPDEVQTQKFIRKWWQQKTILLPSVNGDTLSVKRFEGDESMKPGEAFGILEPTGLDFSAIKTIDLIIVPGIAFDLAGNRMGRGKGYYDKLLNLTNAFRIGVCFNFQLIAKVPVQEHDLPMDKIIIGQKKGL